MIVEFYQFRLIDYKNIHLKFNRNISDLLQLVLNIFLKVNEFQNY